MIVSDSDSGEWTSLVGMLQEEDILGENLLGVLLDF